MNLNGFREHIHRQHDEFCNQKYGIEWPYSFHLKAVEAQGNKFMHLIRDSYITNPQNELSKAVSLREAVRYMLIAHDCIEDARMTYNDLLETVNSKGFGNYVAAQIIADAVYCVTDEKGKTRGERKNAKYYNELKENEYAIFVKLADLAANRLFSKLFNSSMYEKYLKEWPKFKETVYIKKYDEFFDYIEKI